MLLQDMLYLQTHNPGIELFPVPCSEMDCLSENGFVWFYLFKIYLVFIFKILADVKRKALNSVNCVRFNKTL